MQNWISPLTQDPGFKRLNFRTSLPLIVSVPNRRGNHLSSSFPSATAAFYTAQQQHKAQLVLSIDSTKKHHVLQLPSTTSLKRQPSTVPNQSIQATQHWKYYWTVVVLLLSQCRVIPSLLLSQSGSVNHAQKRIQPDTATLPSTTGFYRSALTRRIQ